MFFMRHRQDSPHTYPHNYAVEIEMLRQEVMALTYHQPGDALPPSALDEALEAVAVAFEELHAVNEALIQTQQVAIHEQQRYRELFALAPDSYLVTDLHGLIQEANHAAATLLHIATDQLVGLPLAGFVVPEARQGFRAQIACLRNGSEVHRWEVPMQPLRQAAFSAVCSVAPARDVHGQVIGLRWLLRDNSEQQLALKALERLVQERTAELAQANSALEDALGRTQVLLRELHHRVKNNLQVIASLLNLQSASLHDPHIQKIFQDCQERIRAMALVHELLYRGRDLGRIDLAHYLEALAKQLFGSYCIDPERVHLSIQADEVSLDVNTAIPCGLLCHELLSNCLKHAFPAQQSGEVTVTVRSMLNGQLTVTVHDTGIGFREVVDLHETKSLGLQVACLLAKQLQGTLTLARDRGTCFTLTFPI
jgi:PAS domain S-box-containing protein